MLATVGFASKSPHTDGTIIWLDFIVNVANVRHEIAPLSETSIAHGTFKRPVLIGIITGLALAGASVFRRNQRIQRSWIFFLRNQIDGITHDDIPVAFPSWTWRRRLGDGKRSFGSFDHWALSMGRLADWMLVSPRGRGLSLKIVLATTRTLLASPSDISTPWWGSRQIFISMINRRVQLRDVSWWLMVGVGDIRWQATLYAVSIIPSILNGTHKRRETRQRTRTIGTGVLIHGDLSGLCDLCVSCGEWYGLKTMGRREWRDHVIDGSLVYERRRGFRARYISGKGRVLHCAKKKTRPNTASKRIGPGQGNWKYDR